jgi:hypothetical protein
MKPRPIPKCPKCSSNECVKKIAYGYLPFEKASEMTDSGYVLGGCCIEPDRPEWYCDACEEGFGSRDESWGKLLSDRIQ